MQRLFRIALLVASMSLVEAAQAEGSFQQDLYRALREARPDLHWTADATSGWISADGMGFDLRPIEREVDARRLHGEAAIQFAVAPILQSLDKLRAQSWEAVRAQVVPGLMAPPSGRLGQCRLLTMRQPICLVVDAPQFRKLVTRDEFLQWKVDEATAWDVALSNLDRMPGTSRFKVVPGATGAVMFTYSTRDGSDAARMLLPRVQSVVRELFGGSAFVATPNRDFLVAWGPLRPGSDWSIGQHRQLLAQVAEDAANRPYAISADIYAVDSQGLRIATARERETGVIQDRGAPPASAASAASAR